MGIFCNKNEQKVFFPLFLCKYFVGSKKSSTFAVAFVREYAFFHICGNSSVGRARPCQGRGREFESRLPLKRMAGYKSCFFSLSAARMAELVDALVSGASVERRAGSSPVSGTSGLKYNGYFNKR